MNVPKGNAVALQALKPIENKTADILSGYVFELIKQKKADDAARLKALADKGAAVDEVVSKMDLKIDATLPQFQEASNKYGKSYFDKKYEAERLRGDNSPEAQAKKERLILEANKIKSDYELAKGFYANPEINTKIKEAQKAIAENKLYKGGKSYSSFLAVMGAPSVAGEENGNFGLYHYEQGADKSIKDNKTVFTPVGDLYNNILALEEDTSPKTWTEIDKLNATITNRTDSGIVSRETVKLKEQAVRKSIRDMLGVDNTKPLDEQFESVNELPKETKHLYYDLYKKEPQSKEDFIGFEDKILNRIKSKTNESNRVDVNLPSSSSGSGGSSGGKNYEILTGGNVVRKMEKGGTIEVKNAVVVDLKDKGQIMGIKVPNKNNKGFHIEYAILGKDKFGRSAYERITQKSDAVARLISQKLDPNLFESLVMKQNAAQYTAKNKKDDIGTIKYYNASTSSNNQSDEEDPNMQ
jgi:uncharacterized protein YuzE